MKRLKSRQPDNPTTKTRANASVGGKGRVEETAQTGGQLLQERLMQGRKQLATNIKTQLVAGAIADVVQDLANGDFGDLSSEMLNELFSGLNTPLETQYRVLEAWQDSPKYALPSATTVESNS